MGDLTGEPRGAPGGAPAVDPLRLTACPSCGYSLEALQSEGRCPECGKQYGQRTVVLHGWGADVATARPRFVVVTIACTAYIAWDAWRDGLGDPFGLALAEGLVLWVVASIWRRWGNTMPGLAQVRFSTEGVSQLDASRAATLGIQARRARRFGSWGTWR